MKNKINLKKYLSISIIVIIIFLCIVLLISYEEYKTYNQNYNKKIYSILNIVKEKYPKVTEEELIEILNSNKKKNMNFLRKYGIDENDVLISTNEKSYAVFIIINEMIIIFLGITLIIINLKYETKKERDIKEIENYIEEINNGNYKLNIDNNTEDELSILKNDVYKIMINLKETRDISINDKNKIKEMVEDISHQIKTPLTSIMINIDNLEEYDNLSDNEKNKIIRDIRKEVERINSLVKSLLTLARLDTNSIEFNNKETFLKKIIDESIDKVKLLAELKNIEIKKEVDKNIKLIADFNWQVEAISNILKNAVEHSKEKVEIKVENNKIYTEIKIINDGDIINKKDLKHIFERFYKGENSKPDSIGIGLALSKQLIEAGNGKISVESENNMTIFTIKYFKDASFI